MITCEKCELYPRNDLGYLITCIIFIRLKLYTFLWMEGECFTTVLNWYTYELVKGERGVEINSNDVLRWLYCRTRGTTEEEEVTCIQCSNYRGQWVGGGISPPLGVPHQRRPSKNYFPPPVQHHLPAKRWGTISARSRRGNPLGNGMNPYRRSGFTSYSRVTWSVCGPISQTLPLHIHYWSGV